MNLSLHYEEVASSEGWIPLNGFSKMSLPAMSFLSCDYCCWFFCCFFIPPMNSFNARSHVWLVLRRSRSKMEVVRTEVQTEGNRFLSHCAAAVPGRQWGRWREARNGAIPESLVRNYLEWVCHDQTARRRLLLYAIRQSQRKNPHSLTHSSDSKSTDSVRLTAHFNLSHL